MAELKVIIGADSSEVSKEINKVEKELKKLEAQKQTNIKLGVDTAALDKNIATAKTKLDGLKTSMATATNATTKFNAATANGGNTLMQFSRIAQDAPFGIMGIGNNITATAEAFGNLSKSSGGAGNALKAVASSMLGTGGVLLAVSLVTTALTYMSQNGITVGDVFDKLTGKFDANAKALSEMAAQATKSATEEISGFKALVAAAQNVNISMEDRLRAVKALQKEYPNYFGNLSKEQILNGNVTTAVQELTTALIQKAKAQLFANKIAELAGEEFTLREKLTKATEKLLDAQNALNKSNQQFQSGGGTMGATGVSGIGRLQQAESTYKSILGELAKNVKQQELFTNEINKSTVATLKLNEQIEKPTKAAKTKTEKPKSKDFNFGGGFLGGGIVAPGLALDSPLLRMDIQIDEARVRAAQKLKLWEADFLQFGLNIDSILRTGTEEALAGLGEALGNAFANGQNVFEAVGASMLNSLGQLMANLGKEMIKFGALSIAYGNVIAALKKAFANPFAAIAAGVALTAIGAALSASSKKIGQGGGSSGGSTSGGDYSSPSSSYSSGSSASFTGGTVVFEISGQALVGVLSNTLDKNVRLGGNLGI